MYQRQHTFLPITRVGAECHLGSADSLEGRSFSGDDDNTFFISSVESGGTSISLLFVTITILIVRVISSKWLFGVTISIVIVTTVSKGLGKWLWKAHICNSDCVMYVARIAAT
jgi:hypothetical protein